MKKRGVDSIVNILMRRDHLTRQEAIETVKSAQSEIWDAITGTSCLDPEEVLATELGLEPDYLFDLL